MFLLNCKMIEPPSPVAHYFKMQKKVKHIESRKKKMIKDLRRDQKNMAKIGQKIGVKKQKIAVLEMEIRMTKLGLDMNGSPETGRCVKRRKTKSVQHAPVDTAGTFIQSEDQAPSVSYNPGGGDDDNGRECEPLVASNQVY